MLDAYVHELTNRFHFKSLSLSWILAGRTKMADWRFDVRIKCFSLNLIYPPIPTSLGTSGPLSVFKLIPEVGRWRMRCGSRHFPDRELQKPAADQWVGL